MKRTFKIIQWRRRTLTRTLTENVAQGEITGENIWTHGLLIDTRKHGVGWSEERCWLDKWGSGQIIALVVEVMKRDESFEGRKYM